MADEKIVIGAETKYPLNGILAIPKEMGEHPSADYLIKNKLKLKKGI